MTIKTPHTFIIVQGRDLIQGSKLEEVQHLSCQLIGDQTLTQPRALPSPLGTQGHAQLPGVQTTDLQGSRILCLSIFWGQFTFFQLDEEP
jgi:hypothetical protein